MGDLIPDLILNNPYVTAAGLVLWQVIEIWLGVKKPVDAGSIPQLIWNLLQRFRTKIKTKGATVMPTNPNATSVCMDLDKPVTDLFNAINDALKKIQAGEKPQQVATEVVGPALQLLTELPQVAGDYAADPLSVKRAIALGLLQLEETLLAARLAKAPVTLTGAPAVAPAK